MQGDVVATRGADPRPQRCADRAPARVPVATAGHQDGAAQQAALAHREITVLADRGLPYEVVRKVMTTCTAAAYDKLSLAVLETGGTAPSGG